MDKDVRNTCAFIGRCSLVEIHYAVTPGHQQSAGCYDLPGHPVQNTHQPPCTRSTSSFVALSASDVVFWFVCLSPSAGSGSVGILPVLALGAPHLEQTRCWHLLGGAQAAH